MKFLKYIQEKLQPSQFRDIVKQWKQSGVTKKFDHVFGNKDRLYEPYKGKKITVASPTKKSISHYLEIIHRDIDGFPLYHIESLEDYNAGIVTNRENKRKIKITKVLDSMIAKVKLVKNMSFLANDIETVKKDFINDKTRAFLLLT
jgi:hypothetical protein